MTIEIVTPNNRYGIEKIRLSTEDNTIELIVKIEDDPDGSALAENLSFQKDVVAEGEYANCFNVKLPKSNCICMKGDIANIVDFLKITQAVGIEIAQELEKHIKPLLFQRKPRVSDFFFAKEGQDSESSDDELDAVDKVQELISSFKQPEDRQKALMLFKLAGELEPEKRIVLQQKLSAQITPSRGSNTPTRG